MRRLLAVLFLLALGAIPCLAQAPSEGAVVLPAYLQGAYQPITAQAFMNELGANLQRAGLGKHAYRITEAELQKAGFSTPSRPPSEAVAQGLCSSAGKRYCVWMSLQLSANMTPAQDNLAISGATRFWAYDSSTGQVIMDAPLASVHSLDVTRSPESLAAATKKLVSQNIQDIALQIVTMAQQSEASARVQSWQAAGRPPAQPAGPSQNYTAMLQACRDYAAAVAQSDLMATQDALKRCYTLYPALNGDEKRQIEQQYPGTEQWMNGGSWYGRYYYYR